MKFKGQRVVWLRGWERWRHDSKTIIKMLSSVDRVLVNSEWLQDKLLDSNIPSTIIHQGIDLDEWPDMNDRGKKLTIGCMYHRMESKGWKDFVELQKRLGGGFRYVAYGASRCRDKFLSKYMLQPSHEKLVKLYNMCHFWFAPSWLEGFANPPMEAALCGATVIAINKRSGGTEDWLDHAYSGYRYNKVKDAADWLKSPAIIAKDKFTKNAQHNIREKIGSRESNMKKLVEVLS
jgi:glycosyltransferase involved in cell wall biosynthesis